MRMKACDSRAGLRLAVADRLCVEEKNVLLGETHTGPSGAASDATSHSGWSSFLHYGTTLLFVVVDDVLEGLIPFTILTRLRTSNNCVYEVIRVYPIGLVR